MSLDLTKLISQVGDMVARLKAGSRERQERLDRACETLSSHAGNLDALRDKIAGSKTTWLVAGIVEGLDGCHRPPSLPAEFAVIATDGSHIDVDRHRATRCFLINIGTVMLRYGDNPSAALDSRPRLYAEDEDLVIAASAMRGREQPIEGALLGIKRAVEECRWLADLATSTPPDAPTLALLDGSLILWGLEAYAEFVTEELLDRGFLPGLEKLRQMAGRGSLPWPATSACPAAPMSSTP